MRLDLLLVVAAVALLAAVGRDHEQPRSRPDVTVCPASRPRELVDDDADHHPHPRLY